MYAHIYLYPLSLPPTISFSLSLSTFLRGLVRLLLLVLRGAPLASLACKVGVPSRAYIHTCMYNIYIYVYTCIYV